MRSIRLSRLSRGLRLMKASRRFDSLYLLIRCVSSCGAMLFWSLNFILCIQCVAGMIICNLTMPALIEENALDDVTKEQIWLYYGSFTRTILTMFEVLFANWAPPCRILVDNVSEWFSLFFIIYRCLVGFALLNVVNAVFTQQTIALAQQDVELGIRQKEKQLANYTAKLRKLFERADTSGDGTLDLKEFVKVFEDKRLKFWMSHLELDTTDLVSLFYLLDDGDGQLDVDEFLSGALRFRGPAKGIDLARVLTSSKRMENTLNQLNDVFTSSKRMENKLNQLNDVATESFARLRRKAHKTLTVDMKRSPTNELGRGGSQNLLSCAASRVIGSMRPQPYVDPTSRMDLGMATDKEPDLEELRVTC